ncbi:MAG TPA: hypothetical protein VHR45_14930 [Thermoanaerobaculia bacterium]|nr:hypothetical protein [Thermoanaerobaculia bacterium]
MARSAWKRGLALISVLLVGGSLLGARRAGAVICTIDQVPAATLLLPYFEVDLNNPNGLTTLFSVNNASATAILTHVTVWSDLSVVVLDFDLYLTGYDVQTVNLRDILINGNLPQTADFQDDPGDKISPKGVKSQDISFPGCVGVLPPPILSAAFVTHLQQSLTGKADTLFNGLCFAQNLGDNIARGYITVDTVNNCTLRSPGDLGYFAAGGTGDTTNQNVLWGDWTIFNAVQNFAEGGDLVHIEASGTNPATSTSGRYTFYGRYDGSGPNFFTAVDNREPLATTFATRFVTSGNFGVTSLLVWRDSKNNQSPFTCPVNPTVRPCWYPLGQEGIVIFDEQENPFTPAVQPISPQPPGTTLIPFPAETQRTLVNGASFPVPFNFGWLFLDLNFTAATVACGSTRPPVDPAAAQAWVINTHDYYGSPGNPAAGRFATAIDAIRLDSACSPQHFLPGSI